MSCEFCPTGYPVCPECLGALVARQDQLEASILALVAELAHERARSTAIAKAYQELSRVLKVMIQSGPTYVRWQVMHHCLEELRELGVQP